MTLVAAKRIAGRAADQPATTLMAASLEPALYAAVLGAFRTAAAAVDEHRLQAAAGARDAAGLLQALRLHATAQALRQALRPRLAAIVMAGAGHAAAGLRAIGLPVKRGAAVDLAGVNPAAVAWAEAHAAELVVADDDIKRQIHDLVVASQANRITVAELARQVRALVGLDARRMAALARFEAALKADARLSEAAVLARVGRRAETLLRDRALTIARTETIGALVAGQQALWDQAVAQGLLDRRQFGKIWIVTPDDLLCFPARTKVLTIDGWKPISRIGVGELVLTHEDRFRTVVATTSRRYDGETTRLFFANSIRVTATNGHRILTRRGWIQIEEITTADVVALSGKPCVECGATFPEGPYRHRQRCAACARQIPNRERWSDPNARARVSAWNRTRIKSVEERASLSRASSNPSPETRRRLSETAKARLPYERTTEIRQRQREAQRSSPLAAAKIARQRGRKNPKIAAWHAARSADQKHRQLVLMMSGNTRASKGASSLELSVRRWLDAQGLAYIAQWAFTYRDDDRDRNGFADFYLPGANLVIECDGYFHATNSETQRRDRLRDSALLARGVLTLRFTAPEIKTSFSVVASAIRSRCCIAWSSPTRTRRGHMRHQPVYDLTVDEDHSFIAGGVVAHNCDDCEALDGEVVGLDEQFEDVDGPPLHPNCRCAVGLAPLAEET